MTTSTVVTHGAKCILVNNDAEDKDKEKKIETMK